MKDSRTPSPPPAGATDRTSDWTVDWAEIWQSEWRAMAADRELPQAAAAFVAQWVEGLAALALWPGDGSAGRACSRPAPGPAPPVAASDAGDAGRAQLRIAELAERVAELERRLAALQPADGPSAGR